MSDSREPVAFHESGHAVVALTHPWEVGVNPIQLIAIHDLAESLERPVELLDGTTGLAAGRSRITPIFDIEFLELMVGHRPSAENLRHLRPKMEMQVMTVLGGVAAEGRHAGLPIEELLEAGGNEDYAQAARLIAYFDGAEGVATQISRLAARTAELVGQPGAWAAIETISQQLLDSGQVDGPTAKALYEAAVQEHTTPRRP